MQSVVGNVGFCLFLFGGLLPGLMGHGGALADLHLAYVFELSVIK